MRKINHKDYLKIIHKEAFITVKPVYFLANSNKISDVLGYQILLVQPNDHNVVYTVENNARRFDKQGKLLDKAKRFALEFCNLLNLPFQYDNRIQELPRHKNSICVYDMKRNRKALRFREILVKVKSELPSLAKAGLNFNLIELNNNINS